MDDRAWSGQEFDDDADDPQQLGEELERYVPFDSDELADPALPGGLRLRLARLSVLETVVLALILALMCLGVVIVALRFYPHRKPHAPTTVAKLNTAPITIPCLPGATTAGASPLVEMLAWQFETDHNVGGAAFNRDDWSLCVISQEQRVHVLAEDGGVRFSYQPKDWLSGTFSQPVLTSNSRVIFGTSAGEVVSLNAWGDEEWRFRTQSPVCGAPAVDPYGNAYMCCKDGSIRCLDARGRQAWLCQARGEFGPTGAVRGPGGTIYAITMDSELVLVRRGRIVKQAALGLEPTYAPCPARGRLYAVDDTQLFALDEDGAELWRVKLGYIPCCAPAVDLHGNVYIGDKQGVLYAFDPAGQQLWRQVVYVPFRGIAAQSRNGHIYGWGINGALYAFDNKGAYLYKLDAFGSIASVICTPGDRFYVVSDIGLVSAVHD